MKTKPEVLVGIIKRFVREVNLARFLIEAKLKELKADRKKGAEHIKRYIEPFAKSGNTKKDKIKDLESPLQLGKDTPIATPTKGSKTKPIIFPAGSKIVPIKGSTRWLDAENKRNSGYVSDFHVVNRKNKKTSIIRGVKHTRIETQNEKSGKHTDEFAVVRMWNAVANDPILSKMTVVNGVKTRRIPTIEEMIAAVDAARKDKKHYLNMQNVNATEGDTFKSEFTHGLNGVRDNAITETAKRAEETYYKNLKNAAHTIRALATHKDFAQHWQNGDIFEATGRHLAPLSDLYKSEGVHGQGQMSKADVITVRSSQPGHKALKLISLKDIGGSQLMSSSPEEFAGIYKHSLREHLMKKYGVHPDDPNTESLNSEERIKRLGQVEEEYKQLEPDINDIKARLKNVTGTEQERDQKIKDADEALQKFHEKVSGGREDVFGRPTIKDSSFLTEVHKEAAFGLGKFATEEGTASHLVTIGKGAQVLTKDEWLAKHSSNGTDNFRFNEPRISKGKRGEKEVESEEGESETKASTAVRLDAPKDKSKREALEKDFNKEQAKRAAAEVAVAAVASGSKPVRQSKGVKLRKKTTTGKPAVKRSTKSTEPNHTNLRAANAKQHEKTSLDFRDMNNRITSTDPSRISQPAQTKKPMR